MKNGGFAPGAWAAVLVVSLAFYLLFTYVRTASERAAEGVTPAAWTRFALPIAVGGFLLAALATAWLEPTWFGGVIIGGCIGVTIAFQVRRPRRPFPPPRSEPGVSDPPD